MPKYSLYSNDELTSLLSSGDKQVFTEIYNRYWEKLLAIANNHTKDKSAAEEIVQEVFISLWRRRDIVYVQSLDRYLAKAVKFAVLKQIQRNRRRLEIECDNFSNLELETDENSIDIQFLQEYINGIVEELPEKCRLVFKNSREAGMSISEISKEMHIAEKTVESHLTKALKTIRFSLMKYGVFVFLLSQSL